MLALRRITTHHILCSDDIEFGTEEREDEGRISCLITRSRNKQCDAVLGFLHLRSPLDRFRLLLLPSRSARRPCPTKPRIADLTPAVSIKFIVYMRRRRKREDQTNTTN